jgi:hypothetical protein
MIYWVEIQFDCAYKMENKFPVWKFVSSPTWRKYVKAADNFKE